MALVILEPGESRVLINEGQRTLTFEIPERIQQSYRREFDLSRPLHHSDDDPAHDEMELEDRVTAAHLIA